MKLTFLSLILFISTLAFSQKGDVQIIKDSRIDALVKKQSEVKPPAVHPQIDGYRIQLFFDSDKSKLNANRGSFIARFPKIDTYTTYNAPSFFLKVGDFRTRLEAEKIKAEIEAEFPTSFIVKEKINLPRLNQEMKNN
ncbi:MAG TPA: hypothetical protein EYG86_07680 [Crocinitomicaceae bacterium]|nr:hypothetical protein [Crocinitomicaceae bacterium]